MPWLSPPGPSAALHSACVCPGAAVRWGHGPGAHTAEMSSPFVLEEKGLKPGCEQGPAGGEEASCLLWLPGPRGFISASLRTASPLSLGLSAVRLIKTLVTELRVHLENPR